MVFLAGEWVPAWLWMSVEEILDASRPYLDQGMMGIKVKVGANPNEDADKLARLREALGDDLWLGVDANEGAGFDSSDHTAARSRF